MKKTLFVLLSMLVLTSMLLSACGTPATATQAPATQAPATQAPAAKTVKKIAFFVSDLIERVPPGAGHRGEEVCQGEVRR